MNRDEIIELLQSIKNDPVAVFALKSSPLFDSLPRGYRALAMKRIDECLAAMTQPKKVELLTKRQMRNLKPGSVRRAKAGAKLSPHISTAYSQCKKPINRTAASMMFSGSVFAGTVRKKMKKRK